MSKYIFSNNYVGHTVPTDEIKNSEAKGALKTVVGKDRNNVLFKKNDLLNNKILIKYPYSSNEIEEILIRYKIKSYKVTSQISDTHFIAHNAGNHDLQWHIWRNNKIPIKSFKEILLDTKILHSKGFFHLDIKPSNIQIKKIKNKSTLSKQNT